MRRRTLFVSIGSAVVVLALVTGALIAKGYQVTQTPAVNDTVWALQAGSGTRYGLVNTSLSEMETVKSVKAPSDLVQTASSVAVLSQNDAKIAGVDVASPPDLSSGTSGFESTPPGTASIQSSGNWIAYLTSGGDVYAAGVTSPSNASQVLVDPANKNYSSDAIAVGTDGILYSYSHAQGTVTRVDLATAKVIGTDRVISGPSKDGEQLAAVGDSWALLDASGATLWLPGVGHSIATGLNASARLQQSSDSQQSVVIADQSRLVAVSMSSGSVTRLHGGSGTIGTPAAPAWAGSTVYAAWLPFSTASGGMLWTGSQNRRGVISGQTQVLSYGGQTLTTQAVPSFRTNGQVTILNDAQSGWVWTIPDGKLVTSSQHWDLATPQQTTDQDTGEVTTVTTPEPPVAEPDSFGVRAGSLVRLPVLLNDHDPNNDVLTIIPSSVTGLGSGFGTVSVVNNEQELAVQVAPGASGQASFQYKVTDGTTANGLNSQPTTVTLTVHPPSQNSAPVWCGVQNCLQQWPAPQTSPGGTVSVPVLTGWVDPDGDPIFVSSATTTSGAGTVSTTPDGQLVYQDGNASATSAHTVSVDVAVSDIYGATTQKTLSILVTPKPTLAVTPFAMETSVGQQLTVDPSTHVTGSAGPVTITAATLPPTAQATATVTEGGSSFNFTATQPGSFPVTMTLSDGKSTTTALVRITALPTGSKLLTTEPITVFVRPQQDTTVDPFSAVTNPSGGVLLLSDPKPQNAPDATLDVDAVGEAQLRVRGSTASGQPGVLGTIGYTVSLGGTIPPVQGLATVYLLPAPTPSAPIAVADSATVRVGSEVDIPVLNNDVAADGNTVILNPASIVNESKKGLAFASGSVLRYLAPNTPGTMVVRYSDYITGSPQLTSTTTVTIRVVGAGGDHAPQPQTLTGRVISGQSVSVPFSSFGVDPDGDPVTLNRIVSQPSHGTASISATGNALEYTSTNGYSGQDSFTYQVRDPSGEVGQALAVIGVLSGQTNPAPVTYSDYVQVQAGASNQVVVNPAANDIDPGGLAMNLVSVVPNAPQGTAQYQALKNQIKATTKDQVTIAASGSPGILTYIYSVQDSRGNVGSGLIVVRVVAQPVPDYPIISDTVVSTEQLNQLSQGIDVVTNKVSWTSGDVSDLKLSLWGTPVDGAQVVGDNDISAQAATNGAIIPFALTGKNFAGKTITSYGFLRIPPAWAVVLTLKAGTGETVDEGGQRSFDMASLVSVPPGEQLTVDDSSVRSSGIRSAATCTAAGTVVTYSAGKGAPYQDSCLVSVGLKDGSSASTLLAVPITVIPTEPEPQLGTASLTISPGSPTQTYDLKQMTSWVGASDFASLQYSISYTGSLFRVTQNGTLVQIQANDNATPGLQESIMVSLVGRPDVPSGAIILRVGPAPNSLPQGGTITQSCSEASGTSCVINVIGATGEVNLYPNTPLQLVSVDPAGTCTGISFAVNGQQVTATWTPETLGQACQTRFAVRDAQGHVSGSDGNGTIELSLQGYPPAPASLTQTSYGDNTVTLSVAPGASTTAYPALTGFNVYVGSAEVGTCDVTGSCAVISSPNNLQQLFTARAVNAVGESRTGASVTAWAYNPPGMGPVSAAPIYVAGQTTPGLGVVSVNITNTDPATSSYDLSIDGGSCINVPNTGGAAGIETTTCTSSLVGTTAAIQVTPVSPAALPPDGTGATQTQVSSLVVGGPTVDVSGIGLSRSSSGTTITLSSAARPGSNGSTAQGSLMYVATTGSSSGCSVNFDGSLNAPPGASASLSIPVNASTGYNVFACYSNGYGVASAFVGSSTHVAASGPTGFTYTIGDASGGSWPTYTLTSVSSGSAPSGYEVVYKYNGISYTDSSALIDAVNAANGWGIVPAISVSYCLTTNPSKCGSPEPVVAASGSSAAPWTVTGVNPLICTPATSYAGQASLSTGTAPLVSGSGFDASEVKLSYTGYTAPALNPSGSSSDFVGSAGSGLPLLLNSQTTQVQLSGVTITLPSGATITNFSSGVPGISSAVSCGTPPSASTPTPSGK